MNWYWKVRIYNPEGRYGITQVVTARNIHDIGVVQDFYKDLTGCEMLLEGMSEFPYQSFTSLNSAFTILWSKPRAP